MVEHIARVRWAAHGHEVSSFISGMRDKDMYTDCFLKCKGGELIPAHRLVLAMASPFFSGIFRSACAASNVGGTVTDQIIVLEGVEAEQMEVLLQYAYFGYAIVKCEKLPAISRVAKSLGIKEFPTLEVAPSDTPKSKPIPNYKKCKEILINENSIKKIGSKDEFICPNRKKFKSSCETKNNNEIISPIKNVTNFYKSEIKSPKNGKYQQTYYSSSKKQVGDISNTSFQSLIQPEEIKVEDPDEELIVVCTNPEKKKASQSSEGKKDNNPVRMEESLNNTKGVNNMTSIRNEKDCISVLDHINSSGKRSSDESSFQKEKMVQSFRSSKSVPPKLSSVPPVSPVNRPRSVPTNTAARSTCHNKSEELQLKEQMPIEYTITDVEILDGTVESRHLNLSRISKELFNKPKMSRISRTFENHSNSDGRKSIANNFEIPSDKKYLGEASKQDGIKYKPGPPGLLSMLCDDDYMGCHRNDLIRRDSLIRRNPLIAVPSATRIPLSDQQPPLHYHHGYVAKPHPTYAPLKSIYNKSDSISTHNSIPDGYDISNGESSKSFDEVCYRDSRPSLPLTIPEFDDHPSYMNGFSRNSSYPNESSKIGETSQIPRNYGDSMSHGAQYKGGEFHHNDTTSECIKSSSNSGIVVNSLHSYKYKQTVSNDPLLTKISTTKRKRVRGPKSWEYLLRLLRDPSTNPSLIRWENENERIFRLVKPDAIALRWGKRTGKHFTDMLSYENFARGLRYHYVTGALSAVSERCFVYKFGPKAEEALLSPLDLFEHMTNERHGDGNNLNIENNNESNNKYGIVK